MSDRPDSDFVKAVKANDAYAARLRAEVEQLRRERDEALKERDAANAYVEETAEARMILFGKERDRAVAAEAQVAELREALRRIKNESNEAMIRGIALRYLVGGGAASSTGEERQPVKPWHENLDEEDVAQLAEDRDRS